MQRVMYWFYTLTGKKFYTLTGEKAFPCSLSGCVLDFKVEVFFKLLKAWGECRNVRDAPVVVILGAHH